MAADWTIGGIDGESQGDRDSLADGPACGQQPSMDDPTLETQCEWFALCDGEAYGFVNHPVLGDIRICHQCANVTGVADKVVECDVREFS